MALLKDFYPWRLSNLHDRRYLRSKHKPMHLVFGILALALFFTVEAYAQSNWPADVQDFIQRRDTCDHFRGEDPYDEERRKFLQQKMKEFCIGTDKELSLLKSKYREDKEITFKLNQYEAIIEPSGEK